MALNQLSTRVLYFGGPIVLFVGVRFLGGGPQSTHASSLSSPLDQAPLPVLNLAGGPEASPNDGQAVLLSVQSKLSPFWFDQQIEAPVEHSNPGPEQVDLGGPRVLVSSILPHPTRPLAVINGKPCRLGERVVPGWKLTEIDGDKRTITISNALGEIRVIRISMP